VHQKISADVDGGLSGVSCCADTGARTPMASAEILEIFYLNKAPFLSVMSGSRSAVVLNTVVSKGPFFNFKR
jgi:hypothetical protein